MRIETRLKELGLALPPVPRPVGTYVPYVRTGNLLFVGGKVPYGPDGGVIVGKVGAQISVDEGYQHARLVGLTLVAAMKEALGDLDRVTRIVKVFGMVNAVPDFTDHGTIINGCSDLLVEIFGERGAHARAAVGMGSLPRQVPIEIETVVEVD